jgi:predicted nuclease with RNAse H fold
MSTPAYAGIDVAIARGKRLPLCLAVLEEGRLVPLPLRRLRQPAPPRGGGNVWVLEPQAVRAFAEETAAYLDRVCAAEGLRLSRIGIDAPRDFCPPSIPVRPCEAALFKAGLSCFVTPSRARFEGIVAQARAHLRSGGSPGRLPHANRLWMLAGFALFRTLEGLAECREVYPQAAVRALGAGAIHKTRREGLEAQLQAVAAVTGWPPPATGLRALGEIAYGSAHDRLDAYLSAWVASLGVADLAAYGTPPHDLIWAPCEGQSVGADDPLNLRQT